MKLYIFKTIFIIIIIILLIFAGYSVYKTATKPKKLLEETEETTNNIVKEINLAIAEYDTINPVISNNKNVQDIAKLIYEPLLEITEKFQIKNNYVTEWSKVSEKAYLIKLKNDIKWHNGKTLSTADVKYTIELLKTENINSIYTDNVKNIDTVEIIDDTTIKINLKEEETFFEYNLIFPILPNNSKTTEYIGTGLYKIDLINENSIKLIKNDNYWNENKKATIDVVNIKLYNSMGEVYNAFKLGYVDIINTSNLNYKEYVGKIGYNTAEYVGREYDFLVLNNDNDILNNKNVRQASLYSIDRQKIINEVYDANYYLTEFPLDYGNYLYDKHIRGVKEPFQKLVHEGIILGENGIKMAKRYPEYAINPNDVVSEYGADTLRLYEMFMGPLEADKPWSKKGVEGARRFLDRVYRLYEEKVKDVTNKNLEKIYHQTVKKVTLDYETLNFNTAISQMMIFINAVYKEDVFPLEYATNFVKLLNPIAPFMTEEIWQMLGHDKTIAYEKWPTYDEEKTKEESFEMVVQVNGKVRGKIEVSMETSKEEMETLAQELDNVKKYIENKEVIKIITVPKKLVNIVIK